MELLRSVPHLGRVGERRHRRRCAAIALGVLVGLLWPGSPQAQQPRSDARSVQRSYLIEQKNRVEIPSQYEPMTFAGFLTLPALPARYTASDWQVVRTYTQRAVSLEGYIAEVIHARDGATYGRPPDEGDFHIHLREAREPQCAPESPRDRQIVTEVTPHFQPPKTGWSHEALVNLCRRQVRVRISGWLMHDYQHVQDVGDWRASAWEIHPVLKIEVWSDNQWRELP